MSNNKVLIEFQILQKGKKISVIQKETDKLAKSTNKSATATTRNTKATDRYNRVAKGAGQISSNQTKNFSKMQQSVDGGGGGGLVRAYALLAANVFALTAAFGVLQRSAQIDQLTASMEILSTTGGTNIERLSKKLVEASGGAIALEQSFRQVSLAASAGLNTKEIEGLTLVAKGAALSLGRDLPDALDRIFRGAIKLEPEILDEIGLFVRVDDAAQKYAQTLGKSTASLTQVEKRQAFLNEILEQGTRKFQTYAEQIEPDSFTKLAAALRDIAQDLTSFLNSGLKPFVDFLSNSKDILAGIFVVFAGVLIRQAIPAVGQFTQNLEKSAVQALKDRETFVKAQQDKTKAAKNFALAQNQAELDNARKKQKLTTDANRLDKSPKFKSSAKDALPNKQLTREVDVNKRLALIEKRRVDLTKSRKKVKKDSAVLIDKELASIKKERNELKEVIRLEKEQNLINSQAISAAPGTIADIQNQKTLNKAMSNTAVSSVVASAETKGLKQGFSDYFKTLRTGKVEVEGVEQQMKGTTKASFALKGGVSLLGASFSRLMMMMGPIMMAFTLLSPLLLIGAKKLGLMSEESKKLKDSVKDLDSSTEKLVERFEHQVVAMKNLELTFLENMKASLAFTKSQIETAQQIQEVDNNLNNFQITASKTAMFMEDLKEGAFLGKKGNIFSPGPGNPLSSASTVIQLLISKMSESNREMAKSSIAAATTANAFGAFASENKELIGIYTQFVDLTEDQTEAVTDLQSGTRGLAATENDFNKLMSGNHTLRKAYNKSVEEGIASTKQFGKANDTNSKILKSLSREEKLLLGNRLRSQKLVNDGKIAVTELNFSMEDSLEISEMQIKLLDSQAKAYEAFVSAVEGANQAVRDFQAQAIPKTAVDGVLASVRQIQASLKNLTEVEVETYFKDFADADNLINKLFSTEELKKMNESVEEGRKTFNDVKLELIRIQSVMQLNTSEQKVLNTLIKESARFTKTSGVVAQKIEESKTSAAEKRLELEKETFKTQGRRYGLQFDTLRAEAKSLLQQREAGTLYKDIENGQIKINGVVLDSLDANALMSSELVFQNATFKEQLIIQTEIERKEVARVQTLLNAVKAEQTLLETTKKRQALETKFSLAKNEGRDPTNKATRESLKSAQEEMEMKLKILDTEGTLQQAELALLEAEWKIVSARMGLKETDKEYIEVATAITDASGYITDNIAELKKVAGLDFANKLVGSVTAADMTKPSGISQIGAAEEARSARIKELEKINKDDRTDGENAELKRLQDLNLGYLAIIETVKDYQSQLAKLGPEGEFVAGVIGGTMQLRDSFLNMGEQLDFIKEKAAEGAEGFDAKGVSMANAAARAEFAGAAIGAIGQIMEANSKRQVSALDEQIDAEKRRDGKSAESLARIAALEKKKEAMKKKAFEQNKKVQMAVTIANTAASAMGAMAPPPIGLGPVLGAPLAAMAVAMGALQLAVISRTSYQGGSAGDVPKPNTSLSIGKRGSAVDTAQQTSGGELNYLRGGRTDGTNLGGAGAAMGRKGYANGGEGIVVGERGPEIVSPSAPVDITPNFALGGGETNVNFTINAVDATGVEDLLINQRGNLIRMIREAANENGEEFLPTIDPMAYGSKT